MNRRLLGRTHRALLDRLVLCSLMLIVAGALATPVRAAEVMIDTIVVLLRDEALPNGTLTLSVEKRAALGHLLRNSVTESSRTRDGAFRLTLAHPVPFTEARDAINRVRMQPDVLYASVSAPPQILAQKSLDPGPLFLADRLISQLIVKYRDPALAAASNRNEVLPATQLNRLSLAAGKSVTHLRAMSGGAWVVQLPEPVTRAEAEAMARAIEADPSVEYAEPDLPAEKLTVPNDPNFAVNQWDLQPAATALGGANLQGAWNITTGSASIVVADIDTGILAGHPDLAGRTVAGYDMISNVTTANDGDARDADPTDPGDWTTVANQCGAGTGGPFNSSWHGTHTAGTIGAATNNAVGIAGINWVSKIQAVRVLGVCGGSFADIVDAITWAVGGAVPAVPANATPARVLNMSLGGGGACPASLQSAINAALAAGAVVVVSAGNGNTITDNSTPANCNGVITVASVGRFGNRAYYSNYDNNVAPTYVEIAAPGGEQSFANDPNGTLSTLNAGTTTAGAYNYIYYQGTSMSAPHVTGIASLMLSAKPSLTPAQVLSKIQTTARAFPTGTAAGRDCTSNIALVTTTTKYCGAGIIDAAAAVNSVVIKDSPGLYDAATQTFFLRNTNDSGPADVSFGYGAAGDIPIKGDWNGDGTDTIGVYRPSTGFFYLRNTNSAGPADIAFQFGVGGAVPLAGDWDGNGTTTIGIYDTATGTFFLRNSNSAGPADIVFTFGGGGAGVIPVVGDWNNDGVDTIGLYVAATGVFFLRNTNSSGPANVTFTFGAGGAGIKPITGDWNNDGTTTIGLYNPSTGAFFLRNTNANGPADVTFNFGTGGATPLAGDWDNLP
jgi:serine protease